MKEHENQYYINSKMEKKIGAYSNTDENREKDLSTRNYQNHQTLRNYSR